MNKEDKLVIAGHEFSSRFILGSGKYSMKLIEAAVKYAGAEIITLAVRRANSKEHESILDYIPKGVTLLPNTSGARNAEEAVRIALNAASFASGESFSTSTAEFFENRLSFIPLASSKLTASFVLLSAFPSIKPWT